MKRVLVLFAALCILGVAFVYFAKDRLPESNANSKFVTLNGKQFELDGKPFYPVALNYILDIQVGDDNSLNFTSSRDYGENHQFRYRSADSSVMQLKAEMLYIKSMGFNTVRFVGSEPYLENGMIVFNARRYTTEVDSTLILLKDGNYDKYLKALDVLLETVEQAGLKAIFLITLKPGQPEKDDHFVKVAKHLKDNPALLAYDFFNEPLYFDVPERRKEEVLKITKRWNKLLRTSDPNHLSTIGLEGIREVFEWDPNILDVDFVSFHPYEYEPEQVQNEIYWYSKYVNKPWIIGETAIPADNDSVSYETQRMFAEKTIRRALNCGASGYSWWQYKDVDWGKYHASFMGVVNRLGDTLIGKDQFRVYGTTKPLVSAIQKFDPNAKKEECNCLDNYYNYSRNNKFRITGKLLDKSGNPIVGGVILAWNEGWTHSYHTESKEDGTFELYSEYKFFHWMVSASNYSMLRGEIDPNTAKDENGIPTLNIGTQKIYHLSYGTEAN